MTSRIEAMKWWNAKTYEEQKAIVNKDWVYIQRDPKGLTGREIQEIFIRGYEDIKV